MSDEPEPTTPYPPRYWWLKRLCLAGVGLVIVLGLVHWWWASYANGKLAGVIAEARARGEPVSAADMVEPAVPDAQNAAFYLRRAGKLTQVQPVDEGQVFAELRKARECTEVSWGIKYRTPLIATLVPHLGEQRSLANFLAGVASAAHQAGDDAKAVECLRYLLEAAAATARPNPFLVAHLVALNTGQLATDELAKWAIDIQVAPERTAVPDGQIVQSATRTQIVSLLSGLLDERAVAEGNRGAATAEQAMQVDTMAYLSKQVYVLRPMVQLDTGRAAARARPWISASAQPTLPAALSASLASFPPPKPPNPAQIMGWMFIPNVDRALRRHYRALADRRMAAVTLACRLYEVDHGRLPSRPDELVPDYLPAIPADPFDPAQHPLRFVEAPVPMVYSIGEDGIDRQGGAGDMGWLLARLTAPSTASSPETADE